MNRKSLRSTFTSLCARLTLTAFALSLASPSAWSQAASRAAIAAGASANAAAATAAAGVSAMTLSRAAVSAPVSAPAALSAAALAPAASRPGVAAAAALSAVPAATVSRAVSAKDSLMAAADAADGKSDGGKRFDGGGDGSKFVPKTITAPVIVLLEPAFPGVNTRTLEAKTDSEMRKAMEAALQGSGYAVALMPKELQGQRKIAVLVRLSHPTIDGTVYSTRMEVLKTVLVTGYELADGIAAAKVVEMPLIPSDEVKVKQTKDELLTSLQTYAKIDRSIDADLVNDALEEKNPERLANLLAQNLPFDASVRLELLGATSVEARLAGVLKALKEYGLERMTKPAPTAAARGTVVAGAGDLESLEGLKTKMKAIGMPEHIQKVAIEEFERLSGMNKQDVTAAKTRAYLEWLTSVPWGARTEDTIDVARARRILDQEHFGLERVKERVLEFLALRKKTGSKKGAILAFTGAPGVGKTSIARAIAEAMGRRYTRLALGGVDDEAFLRGHGRTYIGSLPGQIIRQMKEAGTINPVMLMDEVDKIARKGNGGDPTAALLEVLDPEQNGTFRDRYLDVPYDLSQVLFVVTANELSNIPEPVRDRMEIIEFDGYTTPEKIEIAKRHVIPQKLADTGLKDEDARFTDAAIRRVIEGYTAEAGVRTLRQKIEAILRKISAWTETRGEKTPGVVDEKDVAKYLGAQPYSARQVAQNGVGVATGLAVNSLGGSTLNVEVSVEPGSGELTLRNQFGKMIEDSAKNAYQYVKMHKDELGLKDFDFYTHRVDINITPAGDVDGPSAGGLMVTAIVSALTGRPVTPGLAMTGEITKRGDVLPIGGLKQKVMAAHRMGYKMVIYPAANEKDLETIPEDVRREISLKPVANYTEVYPLAIAPAPAGDKTK